MGNKEQSNQAYTDTSAQDDVDSSVLNGGHDDEVRRSTIESIPVKVKANGLPIGVKSKDEQADKRITARMRLFASLIADGASPRDAYKKAYDCSKYSESSVIANANRLMRDARITQLLAPVFQAKSEMVINDAIATRRHVMQELFKHSDDEEIPISVRVRTLELMGKAVGMFVDKVEQRVEEINAEQLKAELSTHLDLLNRVSRH
jgi:hypothetical protein